MDPTSPPRAFAALSVRGLYRRCLDDFCVDEIPAVEPTGEGEHLLLRIEKRGVNSAAVADDLARVFGVAPIDVSFAGMKDRHAVTRQWFSVRTPRDASCMGSIPECWRVIDSIRHRSKLRRGDLTGNRFRIRIRELCGDHEALRERIAGIASTGVPNYFGEQRFGHDGANVERARSWIGSRPRASIPAFQKGLHLSTARALLFNAVLAHRVERGSWNASIDGDVVQTGPTGPLWGRGRTQSTGEARSIEDTALAPYREWLDPLEHLGLTQQRREFVLRPVRLDGVVGGQVLDLEFDLGAGEYATALLRELGAFRNAAMRAAA
ncbi:MAG TPA: tRNA pseudouridine(13) synthase TruD [Pseudomonadales bacterium]